ncbi:hypothetical protein [Zophobihabitans entericus]|uniref:DUF4064 domain-containing protein n=1 Tax=Zophobihabitans entericus TaxID=1635327 RepID=A0A6G9IC28_9GAMM|nr:hypothetical protein [Zophobihabitans entericus]QIQ21379.1 hypothetical protein IPMB12_06560 [Zophobihabitans entericus]
MIIAIIGMLANLLGVYGMYMESVTQYEYYGNYDSVYETVAIIMGISWGISLLGLILVIAGQKKPGAILIIIGSVIFVPLGLIAVFGASRIIKSLQDDDLVVRRMVLNNQSNPANPNNQPLPEIVRRRRQ